MLKIKTILHFLPQCAFSCELWLLAHLTGCTGALADFFFFLFRSAAAAAAPVALVTNLHPSLPSLPTKRARRQAKPFDR